MVRDHEGHLAMGEHGGLGRPVVPEVKKNQHGSSCSTPATVTGWDMGPPQARRSLRRSSSARWRSRSGSPVLPAARSRRARESRCGRSCRTRRSPAPDRRPRPASGGSSSAPRRRRAGSRRTSTRTSGCSSWTAPARGRPFGSPLRQARPPSHRRARSRSDHVQLRSPQTKPIRPHSGAPPAVGNATGSSPGSIRA